MVMKKKNKLLSSTNIDINEIEKLAKNASSEKEQISEKEVKINIGLKKSKHIKLKTYCMHNETTLQSLVSSLIDKFLETKKEL